MPRRRVTFFLDRSLGRHFVAEALTQAGADIRLHDDLFPRDTPDQEWISEVSSSGWSIVTKDRRIRHRPLEIAAVRAARARLFALTIGNASGSEMASVLVRHLKRMERIAMGERPPFIARVSRSRVAVERLKSS